MTIREAQAADLDGLLALYAQLHSDDVLEPDSPLRTLWRRILEDDNYHIVVAEQDGRPVSSCTCVVIPNLTHHQRPYALIENVVTDAPFRGQGLATACLHYARELARAAGCYKLTLTTGSRRESTLSFYRRAGYTDGDKTAFVQWL